MRGEARLRPPWTIGEPAFTDACTGCERVRTCPGPVLGPGDGGLPVFDPRLGKCRFRGGCASTCGAQLRRLVGQRPWTLRAGVGQDCLAARGVACFGCRNACGSAAIRFATARTVAVPEALSGHCAGWGACVAGCAAGALPLAGFHEEAIDA